MSKVYVKLVHGETIVGSLVEQVVATGRTVVRDEAGEQIAEFSSGDAVLVESFATAEALYAKYPRSIIDVTSLTPAPPAPISIEAAPPGQEPTVTADTPPGSPPPAEEIT